MVLQIYPDIDRLLLPEGDVEPLFDLDRDRFLFFLPVEPEERNTKPPPKQANRKSIPNLRKYKRIKRMKKRTKRISMLLV